MSMVSNITGMIASPGQTIEKIAEKPYIEEAVMIVGIVAILSGITAYITSKIIIYDYGNIGGTETDLINIITLLLTIVMPIVITMIVWVIAAGVVHLISVALGGEGEFIQMLVIYGYAYIPILIGGVISIILMMFIEPVTISITDLSQDFTGGLNSDPYYQALNIISFLMGLWSIGFVFMGVKYVHTLTSGKALIAVSIPILFLIVGTVATMFTKLLLNMFV